MYFAIIVVKTLHDVLRHTMAMQFFSFLFLFATQLFCLWSTTTTGVMLPSFSLWYALSGAFCAGPDFFLLKICMPLCSGWFCFSSKQLLSWAPHSWQLICSPHSPFGSIVVLPPPSMSYLASFLFVPIVPFQNSTIFPSWEDDIDLFSFPFFDKYLKFNLSVSTQQTHSVTALW